MLSNANDSSSEELEQRPPIGSIARPLLAWSAAILLLLVFLHIGSEANEGDTQPFDTYILLWGQAMRNSHPGMSDALRDVSGLGSTLVLVILTSSACSFMMLASSRVMAIFLALSMGTGAIAVELFKHSFERLRPNSAFSQYIATGPSFPSGHTSMSAIAFLMLGAVAARSRSRLRERWFIMGVAVVLTVLVGMSRAGSGVHWATDVLGGWSFGAAWAAMWLLVAQRFTPQ